jgi:hypothetical protein
MRYEENLFLSTIDFSKLQDMEIPVLDVTNDPRKKAESNRVRRKVLQQQYEDDYQQALISLKEKYDLLIN